MSLSRDDIRKYKLSKNGIEKNSLEIQVSDDSFEKDALEGWSHPELSLNNLKSIDKKYFRPKLKLYFSSILIITGLFISFILFQKSPTQISKSPKNHIQKQNNHVTTLHPDTINKFQNLPEKLQIKPKSVRVDFKEKTNFESLQSSASTITSSKPEKLPLKKVDKIEPRIKNRINLGKETYLQNLKVIDYRYYRTRPTDEIKNPLSGTSAEKENSSGETWKEQSIVEISYVSYLEKSLKMFNSNEFKNALFRFETILETYPDDVNALFYSSICLYNLNQFELCESRLLQLQKARFTNFDQEQQWYLLLTYKAENKKEMFEQVRSTIVDEKGFYAKKAYNLSFY